MSLSNITVKAVYQGNGSNTTFALPYDVILDDSAETRVYLRDETDPLAVTEELLVEGAMSDYTLTGAVLPTDFHTDVEMNVAPTLTQKLVILRELPLTQLYNQMPDGPVNAKNLNKALDRIVAMVQQVNEKFTRTALTRITWDGPITLPEPVSLQFLRWNEDGDNLENVDIAEIIAEIIAEGGSGVPPGGLTGDILAKLSDGTGDADWLSFAYSGYSAKLNRTVDFATLKEIIDDYIGISYTAPLISLVGSGSGTVREKGDAVTSVNLTATITKRSDPIAAVRFYKDGALIHTVPSPGVGSGTESYTWTGSFSDYSFFRAQVDDNGDTGGPTTVSSNVVEFIFVYPYYYGAGAASLSAAAVAGLTKNVITSNANLTRSFTASANDVLYFAYPASYGALTSILDENGFETIGDWTLRTENITGLDGNAHSYRIYEFNNPLTAGSYTRTFIR